MKITKDFIKKIEGIDKKIRSNSEELNEKLPFVKKANAKKVHMVMRGEKLIELNEETLWTEVYHLGLNCPAGAVLRPLYPELFKLSEENEKLVLEQKKLQIEALGFDFTQMSFANLIKLILEIKHNKEI